MDWEQVIAALRGHESELRAAGLVGLRLFGSTARGDQRADSDIDLLAAFDNDRRLALLDVAGIESRISRILGRTVDLVEGAHLSRECGRASRPRRFVPSKDPIQRFEDILENVVPIDGIHEGNGTISAGSKPHRNGR